MNLDENTLVTDAHIISSQNTLVCLRIVLVMRLTLVPHIKYITGNEICGMNMLRIIAKDSSGTDPYTLEMIY